MWCHHQDGVRSLFRHGTDALNYIEHVHRNGTMEPLQNPACRCQKSGIIGAITLQCLCLLESFVICSPALSSPSIIVIVDV